MKYRREKSATAWSMLSIGTTWEKAVIWARIAKNGVVSIRETVASNYLYAINMETGLEFLTNRPLEDWAQEVFDSEMTRRTSLGQPVVQPRVDMTPTPLLREEVSSSSTQPAVYTAPRQVGTVKPIASLNSSVTHNLDVLNFPDPTGSSNVSVPVFLLSNDP